MEIEVKDVMAKIETVNDGITAVNTLTNQIRKEFEDYKSANEGKNLERKFADQSETFRKLDADLQKALGELEELKKVKAPAGIETTSATYEAEKKLAAYIRNPNSPEAKAALTYVSDITGAYAVGTEIAKNIITNSIAAQPLLDIVDFAGTTNPNNEFPVDTSTASVRDADGATTMPTVNTQTLGRFLCKTHAFDGVVTFDEELIRDSDANIVETMMKKIQEAVDVKHTTMITTGNGTTQFEGLLKNKSIIDSYTVTTSTSTLSLDEFLTFIYSLPSQYAKNGALAMRREIVGLMATFKSSNGYLWVPPSASDAGSFYGKKVVELAEGLDATYTTGKMIAAFGEWKKYVVRVRLDIAIMTLNELYMPYKAFYYKWRAGGGVSLPEAFRVMKVK